MSKKILIFIIISVLLISLISVIAFAEDREYEPYEVTENITISFYFPIDENNTTYNFNYRVNPDSTNRTYTQLSVRDSGTTLYASIGGSYTIYVKPSNNNNSITIYPGQTLSATVVGFLDKYSSFVAPEPPPPPPPQIAPSLWENVSGFFTETLNSGTAIVNWMTATPISLLPLALYCLIVIIAISKRLIKG